MEKMTASITQRATRSAYTAILRSAVLRFTSSIGSFGKVVADVIEASSAIQTARTPEARRAVIDRFAAESARHAQRTAA